MRESQVMVRYAKSSGAMYDELVQNSRRLGIAHACLGLIIATVYWVRPGTFTPYLPVHAHKEIAPIFLTFTAWVPYLIGFLVSKAVLTGRDQNAVVVYIISAVIVTVTAGALYLNVFASPAPQRPIFISFGIVAALVVSTLLCAAIWRSDIP